MSVKRFTHRPELRLDKKRLVVQFSRAFTHILYIFIHLLAEIMSIMVLLTAALIEHVEAGCFY